MGRKLDARDERFVVKDAYLIFYRVVNDEIHIIHIWDSRRNPADLYFTSVP
jgi:plasmid stabilization system protein ParE